MTKASNQEVLNEATGRVTYHAKQLNKIDEQIRETQWWHQRRRWRLWKVWYAESEKYMRAIEDQEVAYFLLTGERMAKPWWERGDPPRG